MEGNVKALGNDCYQICFELLNRADNTVITTIAITGEYLKIMNFLETIKTELHGVHVSDKED